MNKIIISLLLGAFLIGCSKVTIRPDGKPATSRSADYQASEHYFLFTIIGENTVNVTDVCGDKKVEQMQSRFTFVNQLLGGITFGIYTPKTAKVWCK
jgi:hypothetical protein